MRLQRVRVQNYRSIHDTGWFDIEHNKTLLVGPNEAGKSAVLQALHALSPAPGSTPEVQALRDYPRARYSEIDRGVVDPTDAPLATAVFALDDVDRSLLASEAPHLAQATELEITRYYDGTRRFAFRDVAHDARFGEIDKDLLRLQRGLAAAGEEAEPVVAALEELTRGWKESTRLDGQRGSGLDGWLDTAVPHLDLDDQKTEASFDAVRAAARRQRQTIDAYGVIEARIPYFVYFSQYYKVRPRIHLGRLASQEAAGDIDAEYDFGNLCLLSLLGLSAAELAELGRGIPDVVNGRSPSDEDIKSYQDRVDARSYRLNAASVKLTQAVNEVWGEPRDLDIQSDGQYLKVVVRNEDGAQVELDQGSEGFRWLVSFYVVFEAQSSGDYSNAVLLLDEPGMSLHALKQKQFRETVSKIADRNQTIFTTHSPFMVGSDELDKVRIVEMKDRKTGTKVHEDFAVDDPRSLFPLQAHLGYELGQTLFGQRRNLIVEGITDYWYLEAVVEAARDAGETPLEDNVTILPAGDAGKVVYHATVLHAQDLRVAALFDSDTAGETAATSEALAHLLKRKQILMISDFYEGSVERPETEDLIRDTLIEVARDQLGIDAADEAARQPKRPVCDLLAEVGAGGFSKYRLGKAFIRWMRTHGWADLRPGEQQAMRRLFAAANKGTK